MFSPYLLFKFLHVLAVIAWVGGALITSVSTMRLATTQDQALLPAFAERNAFLGRVLFGPAALLTLLAGIATAVVGNLDFGAFWITWGFTGILLSVVLGAVFIRRVTAQLGELTANGAADTQRVRALQGRLALLNSLNTLLLISAVWAMVFKPVL